MSPSLKLRDNIFLLHHDSFNVSNSEDSDGQVGLGMTRLKLWICIMYSSSELFPFSPELLSYINCLRLFDFFGIIVN